MTPRRASHPSIGRTPLVRLSALGGGAAVLALLVVAAVAGGCGKKGPPQPPPRMIPAQITDLRARQIGEQLVLEMAYPAATTSGLPLAGIEALEVLALPPQPGGGTPRVDPRLFEAAAVVAKRLEGAELGAATRGAQLVVTLDVEETSRLRPPASTAGTPLPTAAAAATATAAPPTTDSAATATPPARDADTSVPAPPPDDPIDAAAAPPAQGAPASAGTPTPTATPTSPAPPGPAGPPDPGAILFAVRTFGPRGNRSPISNVVAIAPRTPPPPPDSLTLTAAASGVELAWTAGGGAAAGFDVLRRVEGESSFGDAIAQVPGDRLTHTDATAAFGTRYEYTVRSVAARDPLVESADGPVRAIEYLDVFAPPVPTNVVALAEEGRIRLLWDRVEAPDLAGYRVYRQEDGGAPVELPREAGAGADHVDDQVRSGATYVYRVTAVDLGDNQSEPSEPATATPR